jgi:hypothetical protein
LNDKATSFFVTDSLNLNQGGVFVDVIEDPELAETRERTIENSKYVARGLTAATLR